METLAVPNALRYLSKMKKQHAKKAEAAPTTHVPQTNALNLTDRLRAKLHMGTNKEITDAFAEAHRSCDDHEKRFSVGPNQYTYRELLLEMSHHSHYGAEFINALRRQYG